MGCIFIKILILIKLSGSNCGTKILFLKLKQIWSIINQVLIVILCVYTNILWDLNW